MQKRPPSLSSIWKIQIFAHKEERTISVQNVPCIFHSSGFHQLIGLLSRTLHRTSDYAGGSQFHRNGTMVALMRRAERSMKGQFQNNETDSTCLRVHITLIVYVFMTPKFANAFFHA
jgi:hypothetical protein